MSTFYKDLEVSKKIELEFEQYIKIKYNCLTENSQNKGEFPDWDISITATSKNSLISTFEVKYNKDYIQETIVIEEIAYKNSNADYYIIKIENYINWYMVKKDTLTKLMYGKCWYRDTIITKDEQKLIKIFKRKEFLRNCKIV